MDAGEFRDDNAAAARGFSRAVRSDFRRACGPARSRARFPTRKWRPESPPARRPRRPAISPKPIAFATNCWRRASFSKTPRTESDGKESKAAHQGRACRRPQDGPAATSRSPRPSTPRRATSTKTWSSSIASSGAKSRASAIRAMTTRPTQALEELCAVARERARRAGLQLRDGRDSRRFAHGADRSPEVHCGRQRPVRRDGKPADDGARAAGRGRAFRGYLQPGRSRERHRGSQARAAS